MLKKIFSGGIALLIVVSLGQIAFADSRQLLMEAKEREAKAEINTPTVPLGEGGFVSSLKISSRSTQTGPTRDYNKKNMKVIFSQFGSSMQFDLDSSDGKQKCYLKTLLWDWNPLVRDPLSTSEDYFISGESSKSVGMGAHGSARRYYSFETKGQAFEAERVELSSFN